jgi:hypothetical protein
MKALPPNASESRGGIFAVNSGPQGTPDHADTAAVVAAIAAHRFVQRSTNP